jgi:membrane-associated phospholipid phosphatase
MDALGCKAAHSVRDQLVYFGQAELIMMGLVYPLKTMTHVPRPDYSSDNSFPSGHTAQAFVAAQFFQKEYGHRYPWLSAGMYTLATGIGVSRVLNNRHWASDVLAGAGLGMGSVELSYLLVAHHHKSHTAFQPLIFPSYANGIYSCSMVVGL